MQRADLPHISGVGPGVLHFPDAEIRQQYEPGQGDCPAGEPANRPRFSAEPEQMEELLQARHADHGE